MKYLICIFTILIIILVLKRLILRQNFNNYIKQAGKIIERNINIDFPTIKEEKIIPKNILQTHENIDLVPDYVISNIKNKNPNYKYYFYDNNMRKEFMLKYFGQVYLDKMNSFKYGMHKADLFRMCWLYINGGVYMDIDVEILVPLDHLVKNEFSMSCTKLRENFTQDYTRALNCIIFSPKGNKILKKCILSVMKVKNEDLGYRSLTIIYVLSEILKKEKINFFSTEDYYTCKIYKENKFIANSRYKNYKFGKFKK